MLASIGIKVLTSYERKEVNSTLCDASVQCQPEQIDVDVQANSIGRYGIIICIRVTLYWIQMADGQFRPVSNGQQWTFETSDVTWSQKSTLQGGHGTG